MKIQSQEDADDANERFNNFHDEFIKRVQVTSANEFLTDMPWEPKRQFNTNADELQATSLCTGEGNSIELTIAHYNYDWPDQPRTRAIVIRASTITEMADNLLTFIGSNIFDISFSVQKSVVSCIIASPYKQAGSIRTMNNSDKVLLFSAKQVEIEETIWADRDRSSLSRGRPSHPTGRTDRVSGGSAAPERN